MIIGILKEPTDEKRVVALPEIAGQLVKMNFEVQIETGAGTSAFASDANYQEAGAKTAERDEIISKADLILSINRPSDAELGKMKEGGMLLAVFQPLINKDLVLQLVEKGITSFSMDMIPRTSRAQTMDILSSQATVAGYKAVLTAAMYLPKYFPMFMTAAGSITPAKVLILGAGVAGLQAIATSRRLGAVVEAFDTRSAVKEEVKSLGAKF
ncbi:MAG: NAD(P)(+) transhydrogenase (Re/Si-specific) subunit alpha, partial [Chitinophagales bacterium]